MGHLLTLLKPQDGFTFNFANGVGPFTFTRASSKAFYNSTPLRSSVAVNIPAVECDPTTGAVLGVSIHGQFTNLILKSRDASDGAWFKANAIIVTANQAVGEDGTMGMDLLNDPSTGFVSGINQSQTITSSTNPFVARCIFKAGTSSVQSIRVTLQGGTLGVVAEGVFNTATGACQWRTGLSGTTIKMTPTSGGRYECLVVVTDNGTGNNAAIVEFRPAFASTYSPTLDIAATGTCYIDEMMGGFGNGTTPFVETDTTPVTRSQDFCSTTNLAAVGYNPIQGTIFVSFILSALVSGQRVINIDNGSTGNRIVISITGSSVLVTITSASTQLMSATVGTATVGSLIKVAIAYAPNDMAACCNGGAVSTATGAVPINISKFNVGADQSGANPLNGIVQTIKCDPQRFTNSQLQALTTL